MQRPLLQVALDQTNLPDALLAAKKLENYLDVIEAGTILCYAEGAKTIKSLRTLHRNHIVVADLKAADAGEVVAEMVFSRGATWMTCICAAPMATIEAALKVAKKYNGDVQIELYGNWTFENAEQWKNIGISQVIYHRGRDAELAGQKWTESDIKKIKKLSEMGMEVSVTGGLSPEDLKLFSGIDVKCFIAGRSLYGAENPAETAKAFKDEIKRIWG